MSAHQLRVAYRIINARKGLKSTIDMPIIFNKALIPTLSLWKEFVNIPRKQ